MADLTRSTNTVKDSAEATVTVQSYVDPNQSNARGAIVAVLLEDGSLLDVGQKAGAASLSVVLASDQAAVAVADGGGSLTVDGTVELGATALAALETITVAQVTAPLAAGTNNIGDVDIASIAAGENHVGQVGAPGDLITVTPTLDTSAYVSGDTLFDATAVTNAVRVAGGRAILQSLTVIDVDDQGAGFDLFFFDSTITFGTLNAAPSISDGDAAKCLGCVQVNAADFIDMGGSQVACVTGVGLVLEPVSGRDVYCAAITRGTPTYTASGLKLKLGLLWD